MIHLTESMTCVLDMQAGVTDMVHDNDLNDFREIMRESDHAYDSLVGDILSPGEVELLFEGTAPSEVR